jgi:hypothetical protein
MELDCGLIQVQLIQVQLIQSSCAVEPNVHGRRMVKEGPVRVACALVGACSGGAVHTVIGGRRHLGGLLVCKESFDKVGHVVTAGAQLMEERTQMKVARCGRRRGVAEEGDGRLASIGELTLKGSSVNGIRDLGSHHHHRYTCNI